MNVPEELLRDWSRVAVLVNQVECELGYELSAGELADLLAVNFPWPLDFCYAMRDLVLQVRLIAPERVRGRAGR